MAQRSSTLYLERWEEMLRKAIAQTEGSTDLIGIGNPLRGDDAVGLEIVSRLRAGLGPVPAKGVRIHEASLAPERLLSRLAAASGRIVVFDAIQASVAPGEIVCASLADTKYGFFATHNIPLRIVPWLAERLDDVLVVGVQPDSLEVGEGLSDAVEAAAGRIVNAVSRALEARA